MERRLDALEKALASMKQPSPTPDKPPEPQIVIEYIHVERLTVDRVDYENNFGNLGIRELQGQLNIGANYRTGTPRPPKTGGGGQTSGGGNPPLAGGGATKQQGVPPGGGPRVNVKPRRQNGG